MKFDGRCFYVSFCAVLLLVISTAAQERHIRNSKLPPVQKLRTTRAREQRFEAIRLKWRTENGNTNWKA